VNHLSDEQLFSESARPLTPDELAHLDTCPRCRMERLRYDRSRALAVESGVVDTLVGLNDEIGHSLVSSLTAEWWCDGFGTVVQSDGLDWWRHERRAIDGDASDRARRVSALGVAGLVPWRVEGSAVFSRWYPGVTLDRALEREPAETAQRFASRILEDVAVLLQRLHAGGLAHGAVRPSRVLVKDGRGALLLSALTPDNPRSDRAAFQRMVHDMLGVAVPEDLGAAHHGIVDHALSQVFHDVPSDRTDGSRRRGFLVGRSQESAALQALVRGGVRLVSVLGPPGIGKTAFLEHVLPTLGPFLRLDATSLTTNPAGGSEPGRIVALNGIDDAIDLAARRIGEWLEHTEHTFVVAAEQPLRLRGEQVLRLGPLDPDSAAALFQAAARGSDVRSALELAAGVPRAIELLAAGTDPVLEGPYDRALTQSFERLPSILQDTLRMVAARETIATAWVGGEADDRLMELADRSWLVVDGAAVGSVSLLPPMRRWLEKRGLA
jgi:hypothetical protein